MKTPIDRSTGFTLILSLVLLVLTFSPLTAQEAQEAEAQKGCCENCMKDGKMQAH